MPSLVLCGNVASLVLCMQLVDDQPGPKLSIDDQLGLKQLGYDEPRRVMTCLVPCSMAVGQTGKNNIEKRHCGPGNAQPTNN